ncbi:hypothetical protein B0H14DRAFT_2596737 [Mycena olivaceomarginata]|nr:hypothetical protein B0H14DRAFT_2596737 [Mycena olivaceomarginata]
MCVPLCFHRCWNYNPDLKIIFTRWDVSSTVQNYIKAFLVALPAAPSIRETRVSSVAYCSTRGLRGYPFLIVRLRHPHFNLPILMQLCGDDESPLLTLGRVDSSVRRLVGTWRYDVWQTVVFPPYQSPPTLPDLLALAEFADERDWTRARYPETLFFAIKALFNGAVSIGINLRSGKAALATLDVADEAKNGVIAAFPAQRQRLEEKIVLRCERIIRVYVGLRILGRNVRTDSTTYQKQVDPIAHSTESSMDLERALERVAFLEDMVVSLMTVPETQNSLTTDKDA